jgi:hypothetical protein
MFIRMDLGFFGDVSSLESPSEEEEEEEEEEELSIPVRQEATPYVCTSSCKRRHTHAAY